MNSVTDEIKLRVDLVELIGRTVELRRVGSAYRGLCPFHSEKTPSFYVRPDAHSYHCFGCNKSGTAFDWLMEREHVDFAEALRMLAQQTGVPLPDRSDPEDEERRQRLLRILERSSSYYQGMLWGSSGVRARSYLERRELSEATIKAFALGYAPPGNVLLRYLDRDGFGEQELQAAGVIGVADDGHPFDFFRERLIFPIRDAQGRTIAFGGRSLEDGATPKYLNSRDTLLFHKSETLYAFDAARRSILQDRQVVIVEGYMDALTAHQHGYRNVVATLGTAVTDRHLRQVRRLVDDIVLALDADAAGQAATWRALQVADGSLRAGMTPVVAPTRREQRAVPARSARLRVLTLPHAKDPDELIRADPATWRVLVTSALPVVDFILERVGSRHDLSTAEGKAAAAEEVAAVLQGIANPIEQDHYIQQAETILRLHHGSLRKLLARSARKPAPQPRAPETKRDATGSVHDDYLMALLICRRELLGEATPVENLEFVLPESRALYAALAGEVPPELRPHLARAEAYLPLVRQLSAEALAQGIQEKQLDILKLRLERDRQAINGVGIDQEIRSLDTQLAELARRIAAIEEQLPPERERARSR
ncbi:MAG: DNA primase [Chloroflexota bacterium]|nr:DNA primase [Chloroflexota bacterium]